jgi:hypothetical protein
VWSVADGRRRIAALQAVEAAQGPAAALLAWKAALEDPVEQEQFHSASIWAAIRADHGGVLRTPYGVLLAEQRLVMQAFAAEGELSVCGYHRRLAPSIGEIYLALDDGPAYRALSTATNAAIAAIPRDAAFGASRDITTLLLEQVFLTPARQALVNPADPARWELTLDIQELIDPVLARLCQAWFGLPADATADIAPGSARWDGDPRQALYPGSPSRAPPCRPRPSASAPRPRRPSRASCAPTRGHWAAAPSARPSSSRAAATWH